MAKVVCHTHADTGVSRRTWQTAWAPADTILRYSIIGLLSGMALLLPAALLLERAALAVPPVLLGLGVTTGYLRWRFSCRYVNNAYGNVLCESFRLYREATADSTVYISSLSASGTQRGIVPASRYSLNMVEVSSECIRIADVQIDTRTFEVTARSTKVPIERVQSRSFTDGTFQVQSTRGSWTVEELNVLSSKQFSVDDWEEHSRGK